MVLQNIIRSPWLTIDTPPFQLGQAEPTCFFRAIFILLIVSAFLFCPTLPARCFSFVSAECVLPSIPDGFPVNALDIFSRTSFLFAGLSSPEIPGLPSILPGFPNAGFFFPFLQQDLHSVLLLIAILNFLTFLYVIVSLHVGHFLSFINYIPCEQLKTYQ